MSFEIKYDRDGQVISSEPVAPVVEQEQEPVEQELEVAEQEQKPEQDPVIQQPKPSEPSDSFSRLRQARERAERERDELLRRVQELEAARQQVPQEEEKELAPDDLVEARYVNKKIKSLQQQIQQQQQQSYELSVEAKLKSQFPDFDAVVNKDNISMLRDIEPEIAATINSNTDLYAKAVSAYKMIKKLGLAPQDDYGKDRELVQRNAAKPRTLTSISPQQGESPLSRANAFANGLTEDLQKQLRKEMEEARKRM